MGGYSTRDFPCLAMPVPRGSARYCGVFFSQSRNDWALMSGAIVSAFEWLLFPSLPSMPKSGDSAMALILSSSHSVSAYLPVYSNLLEGVANLESYLLIIGGFSHADLFPMVFCLLCVVLTLVGLHKELIISGFDPTYARSIGLPLDWIQFLLSALLAFCIVTSLQTIGVVLVSALLIIPASTSWLLTHRLSHLLTLSAVIGGLSGVLGCFLSFLHHRLPAGPTIILCSTFIFLCVLLFSPKRGMIPEWIRSKKLGRKIRLENTLKACFQVLEQSNFEVESFPQSHLARRRGKSAAATEKEMDVLIRQGYATRIHKPLIQSNELPSEPVISLTPSGWEVACRMIRNHRLWELYLTQEASYASDHVHDDAEKIEHIIGEKTVRRLERILSNPRLDPHGKPIPSQSDIDRGWISSTQEKPI